MNILEMTNSFEKHICDKADLYNIPIGATFELIPACNMDCKMCYIRMPYNEMMDKGGYLSKERWFRYLESAKEAGTLFLLLTGGEPLLYPHFKDVYLKAKTLGFVVCVNTNGTLINEEIADFFASNAPRRLNVSIYGSNNKTYEKLCNNPKGFDQFNRAIQLLKQRKVPVKLNASLTPQNIYDLDDMIMYAKENQLDIEVVSYMFPPSRKENRDLNLENRLTLEQQVNARIRYEQMTSTLEEFMQKAKAIEYVVNHDVELPPKKPNVGFSCRSGSSTYWITWQGKMIPCGMFNYPSIDLNSSTIKDAFSKMVDIIKTFKRSDKCYACKKEYICQVCSAAAIAETGRFDGTSKHHCDACNLYIEKMKKYVHTNEQNN